MFLILLVLFPVASYFIFNKFKDDIIELNWVAKAIWLLWLFIFVFVGTSEIFDNNESYLLLLIFWYIWVFLYYYIHIARLQFKNSKKLVFQSTTFSYKLIKILFLILLFFFYISIIENYDVNNKLDLLRGNNDSFLNFISIYFSSIILCWIFYEVAEVLKKTILINESTKEDYRVKLKNELKNEILKELNFNK